MSILSEYELIGGGPKESFEGCYDWDAAIQEAMGPGYWGPDDSTHYVHEEMKASQKSLWNGVASVLASSEGENDGPSWMTIFFMHDGRFAFMEASCDYTGWD